MSQPRRDWSDARAKVESEEICRVCGRSICLEAAHIMGRVHDPQKGQSKTRYVRPESIVPLCGSLAPEFSCHVLYDAHQIDLLPYLTKEEQAQAVLDAGSIDSARRRLCPSEFREPPQLQEAATTASMRGAQT